MLNLRLTEKVRWVIQNENISEEELALMVKGAAITSIRGFNRRYFHWILRIEDSLVMDMQHVEMIEVGHGDFLQREEHEPCNGQGCKACGWIGDTGRWITDKVIPVHEPLRLQRSAYR